MKKTIEGNNSYLSGYLGNYNLSIGKIITKMKYHDILFTNKKQITNLFLVILFSVTATVQLGAQISNSGCVSGDWGIDAGLYSGTVEYGAGTPAFNSNDWFTGVSGIGVINEADVNTLKSILQTEENPEYKRNQAYPKVTIVNNKILVDALFARDHFGGTGYRDNTSYTQASKNGEDPAIWSPGISNVLGKNDIIDVGGHMFRVGGTLFDDLWFVGLFNMAEPGGTSYMDFEFYVDNLQYTDGSGFSSGGPQLGHTAYNFEESTTTPGKFKISKVGDFIFSVALTGTGTEVETRIWVSRTDWMTKSPLTFKYTGTFDGAYNGSPYGYAGIEPLGAGEICGYVNMSNESPLAPPWGTKNTKTNIWKDSYAPSSLAEVGINMTTLGMDHSSLSGQDPCYFPINSFVVKTRASASFTAQLKDFAGPFEWGQPDFLLEISSTQISCDNPSAIITVVPSRTDVSYEWSTLDGNFLPTANPYEVEATKVGNYSVTVTLPTNCPVQVRDIVVTSDPSKPFLNEPPVITSTTSCNANDGTINVVVTGGTPPYTYTWLKDGNPFIATTDSTITGLEPGTYSATIKGTGACEITTGDVVIAAKIPVVITPSLTHIICNGVKNGAINLEVSGGKTPLSFLWSTGNTSQNLLNIGAGNYSVVITDADGCTTSGSYTITQPSALTVSVIKINDTNDDPLVGNGTIDITTAGGTPDYSYQWIGPDGFSSSNEDLTDLKYGNYTVTVTDASGCTKSESVFIYEPEICNDGIDNDGDGLNNCNDSECTPVIPGTIIPDNTSPCVNIAVNYSVPANADYDSYLWEVPATATINSGQDTNSINVTWNSTAGGQICVRGKKSDCLSNPSCITVNVEAVPPTPGTIILNN